VSGEGEDKGFKVVDRRHSADAEDAAPDSPAGQPHAEDEFSAIDFSTLCLSLSTSAFIHLGAMPNPDTGKVEVHLPLARQTIDTLAMLQDKTRGNLTKDEGRLLEHLLFDLRLKFVEASKATPK
jgi:hypothetical protein